MIKKKKNTKENRVDKKESGKDKLSCCRQAGTEMIREKQKDRRKIKRKNEDKKKEHTESGKK